jgi:hypothetical protein
VLKDFDPILKRNWPIAIRIELKTIIDTAKRLITNSSPMFVR